MNPVTDVETQVVEHAADSPSATASSSSPPSPEGREDAENPQDPKDAEDGLLTEMATRIALAMSYKKKLADAEAAVLAHSQEFPEGSLYSVQVGDVVFAIQPGNVASVGKPFKIE